MPTLEALKLFLLCGLGIAYALLLVWFAVFVYFHDAVHRLHVRWFRR